MMDRLEDSIHDYSVLFYLEGLERRFQYGVAKETSDRIREELDREETGNLIFETCRPAERVVINSRFVQAACFEWRPKNVDAGLPDNGAGERARYGNGGNGGAGDGNGGGIGGGSGDQAASHEVPGSGRDDAVLLYFRGRESPIALIVDDPEEVFDLLLAMKTEAFPRGAIVDAAGNETVLDLRTLACAEFPVGLADRGEAQALFEVQEEV